MGQTIARRGLSRPCRKPDRRRKRSSVPLNFVNLSGTFTVISKDCPTRRLVAYSRETIRRTYGILYRLW